MSSEIPNDNIDNFNNLLEEVKSMHEEKEGLKR